MLAFHLMKFPITPLTLPITVHCQTTPPAFLQLGGKGILSATAVQQQRDWIPDARERLAMFGVAELLIAEGGPGVPERAPAFLQLGGKGQGGEGK